MVLSKEVADTLCDIMGEQERRAVKATGASVKPFEVMLRRRVNLDARLVTGVSRTLGVAEDAVRVVLRAVIERCCDDEVEPSPVTLAEADWLGTIGVTWTRGVYYGDDI